MGQTCKEKYGPSLFPPLLEPDKPWREPQGGGNSGKLLLPFPRMEDAGGEVISCSVYEYMFSQQYISPYSFPDTTHCGHYNSRSAAELLIIMHS